MFENLQQIDPREAKVVRKLQGTIGVAMKLRASFDRLHAEVGHGFGIKEVEEADGKLNEMLEILHGVGAELTLMDEGEASQSLGLLLTGRA